MQRDTMRLDVSDGVAHIVFTQPVRGNPIDETFCRDFCEIANIVSDDTAVRAVLISAEGKEFSYGGDLSMFRNKIDELSLTIRRMTGDLHAGIIRLQRMDAPIVAAVHGLCVGGMAAVVAGADLLIAADNAKFVSAYVGIAFANDAGSSVMFTRRMGPSRARRFLLLNETLDASQALASGLADQVVAPDALMATALDHVRRLGTGPTKAIGEIRRLLMTAQYTPIETQLELEAQALCRVAATADARGAICAFSEKRRYEFEGR